jgi:hypothetical protein
LKCHHCVVLKARPVLRGHTSRRTVCATSETLRRCPAMSMG